MLARAFALVVALTAAAPALAAGLEQVEQSPTAAGMGGAATADAYEPAAAYYDPAALAFQEGLTVMAGAAVELYRGSYTAGATFARTGTFATPTVFAGQRVSARYAVGIGVYEPFAWSAAYASPLGQNALDLHTYDVNPSIAVRPRPWIALGFGVDIVPSTFDWRIADNDPNAPQRRYRDGATGLGGNASVLVRVVPRWLDAAVSYRSAVDLDLGNAPGAHATLPLPHTFAFGLASRPLRGLTVTTDVRLALWHDLHDVTFTSGPGTEDAIQLGWQDSVGVRVGASYGMLRDRDDAPRLTVRVGGGWDETPASPAAAFPLLAQGDRGLVAAGVGGRLGAWSLDVGYTLAIEPDTPGVYGTSAVRYSAVVHVLVAAVTLRLPDLPHRLDEPDYRH